MKIERPDWVNFVGLPKEYEDTMDDWFSDNVEPINKMLDGAETVYGENDDCWFTRDAGNFETNTHKALLINIEPIKKETAEDVLRDLYDVLRDLYNDPGIAEADEFWERAKKVLGEL